MDETYIREAIELARAAVANGNTPFGSLLVVDETVVGRSENTTLTDDDVTAHPELKLARWAARELDADELAACTMYRRYKATAPGLDPGVEADNTQPLLRLSANYS